MTKSELAPFVYGHSVKAMRKWFLGQLIFVHVKCGITYMTKSELAPFVYGHSVKAKFLGQSNIGSRHMWNHVHDKK